MENNKLIAEFMGTSIGYGNDYYTNDKFPYNTSWDWLMPVVIECFERFGNTDTIDYMRLNDALLTCNIDELYKVVVEFIKQTKNK